MRSAFTRLVSTAVAASLLTALLPIASVSAEELPADGTVVREQVVPATHAQVLRYPLGVGYNGMTGKLLVSDSAAKNVALIDPATGSILATSPTTPDGPFMAPADLAPGTRGALLDTARSAVYGAEHDGALTPIYRPSTPRAPRRSRSSAIATRAGSTG